MHPDFGDQAACIGTPIDWWFPESPDHVPPEAAALCAECPVRRRCHSHALRHEDAGVWAGTSEKGRRRARQAAGIRLDAADLVVRIRTEAHLWGGGSA